MLHIPDHKDSIMAKITTSLDEAADVLRRGEPAIFPTETVYGLGVAVFAADSPDILFELKHRDRAKPIAWLVGQVDDLDRFGRAVPEFARVLARTFWPGPLTLVVKASELVPEAFRSEEDTIGLRMPNNQTALALIQAVGSPLATTSANISGAKSPCSCDAVNPRLADKVSLILADSSDDDKSGVSSSVVDCTHDHPIMMREGGISIASIQAHS